MSGRQVRRRRVRPPAPDGPVRVSARVCEAASCVSAGSEEITDAVAEWVHGAGITDVEVRRVGCLGLCSAGPLVEVPETGQLFERVAPERMGPLLETLRSAEPAPGIRPATRPGPAAQDAGPLAPAAGHVPTASPVTADAAESTPTTAGPFTVDAAGPTPTAAGRVPAAQRAFFARQVRVVTENCGVIDPDSLDDARAHHAYEALEHALAEMTPAQVIDEITRSGLRGRGGGGYPTGLKWATVAKAPGSPKHVVCNADEGDPGAFMDRSVLESDPHRVLEGMTLAAYAVGADHGYVYCRAEYPLAVERLRTAIRLARRDGLLGEEIAGTGFTFQVDVRLGAGAFVCGEETALIASVQGGRGTPRPRPPYPATAGLWGRPTLINNVETFAGVAPVVRRGGDWYAGIGTGSSRGTKVFALAGKIVNTGLVEVPMGITLREIVDDIGGGLVGGRPCKAVQTGGPSGGCIPADLLDMPVDYESLRAAGSIMGSGGMIVMDDRACMVDVARYFMDFCREESCGKCVPCRVGTTQMHTLLTRITTGQAETRDLELLERLAGTVQRTSLCGLGQTAPNPVFSTLRYFRDEYRAHIEDRVCTAGVCALRPAPALAGAGDGRRADR